MFWQMFVKYYVMTQPVVVPPRARRRVAARETRSLPFQIPRAAPATGFCSPLILKATVRSTTVNLK